MEWLPFPPRLLFPRHANAWCDSFPSSLSDRWMRVGVFSLPPGVFSPPPVFSEGVHTASTPHGFASVGTCSGTETLTASAAPSFVSWERLPEKPLSSGGDKWESRLQHLLFWRFLLDPLRSPGFFRYRAPMCVSKRSQLLLLDPSYLAKGCRKIYCLLTGTSQSRPHHLFFDDLGRTPYDSVGLTATRLRRAHRSAYSSACSHIFRDEMPEKLPPSGGGESTSSPTPPILVPSFEPLAISWAFPLPDSSLFFFLFFLLSINSSSLHIIALSFSYFLLRTNLS